MGISPGEWAIIITTLVSALASAIYSIRAGRTVADVRDEREALWQAIHDIKKEAEDHRRQFEAFRGELKEVIRNFRSGANDRYSR